jgi:ATP-binding cassette subfamily B protein
LYRELLSKQHGKLPVAPVPSQQPA